MHQFVPNFKAHYLVLFPFLLMLICSTHLLSQAVAFCGIDGDVGEEVAFVALRDLAPGEQIFITEDEYSDFTNEFESNEGHIVYTAPAGGLAENSVVIISETSAQVFTITGGGTAAAVGTGDWSFSNQDEMYAYSASNSSSPWNTVTEVHCFLWTSVVAPPADQQVDNDWPNAITIAFNIGGPGGVNANFNDAARVNTTLAMLLDGNNWTTSTGDVILSPTNFTNQMIAASGCTPVINGITVTNCPDNPNGIFTLNVDGALNGADSWGINFTNGAACGSFIPQFTFTESFTLSFDPPTNEVVIFSIGSCQAEQVCYTFIPSELLVIPVFSLATTTYNELDGIQANLGGATPVGGTYSGPGVTDNGNGMTFSFNPAAAGGGVHNITYTTPATGPCGSYSTSVSVTVVAPSITFPALGTVCEGSGVQTITGGATPVGGVYSGTGVTDGGNGTSFSFNPSITGVGSTSVNYTIGSSTASSTLTVAALPTVTFTSSLSTVSADAGLQTSISGGSPAGGIYSGPGVTDEGNGLSFSFDPAAAGTGEVIVTYTFTDGNGCSNNQSDVITVEDAQLPGDICPDAIDINVLFTGPLNEAVVSTTQDNTGYDADNDPGAGYDCWFGDAPVLNNTIWYAFTGDGEKYSIRSIACGDNAMTNTDTQFALYSGDCTTPVAVACNDDEDFDNAVYNSYLEIVTEPGVEYLLMVDGYVAAADYAAIGSFCLEVTLLESVGVTDLANTDLVVYPNPTNGEIQLPQIDMERVEVYNATGQLVVKRTTVERTIDLAAQPAGLYLLKIYADGVIYSAKVVKQ